MKIAPRNIERFCKSPDSGVRAVLLFGPDQGMIRERADQIGRTVVEDLQDPFNVVDLTPEDLSETPTRLMDEAAAISMMGGKRLLRMRGGGDALAAAVTDLLDAPHCDALLVIEAGDLKPSSKLRKLAESHKQAAAIANYVDDERQLTRFIIDHLSSQGLSADRDTLGYLSEHLIGDRLLARRELDKLVLYMGDGAREVRLDDARAAIGDSAAVSVDDVIQAMFRGDRSAVLTETDRFFGDKKPPIALLRGVQRHFTRLHIAASHMSGGMDAETAMKKLRPPVFWKQKSMFEAALNSWTVPALTDALIRINDTEAQTKRTGQPAQLLTQRALIALTRPRRR
ncbi:MAG: DNA polymerase III subunit delta [Alphaproteobacteria bacterium]